MAEQVTAYRCKGCGLISARETTFTPAHGDWVPVSIVADFVRTSKALTDATSVPVCGNCRGKITETIHLLMRLLTNGSGA